MADVIGLTVSGMGLALILFERGPATSLRTAQSER
jgi:hypothetical protein